MRRGLFLTAVALLLGGCGGRTPSPTPAPQVVSIVQDDAELLHRSPEQTAATLDDLHDLGVDWVRVTAGWSVIAPEPQARTMPAFDATNPDAYPAGAWDALDRLALGTAERGLRLNVDVAFWAPRWAVARPVGRATTERDGIDARKLADFAEAVARRYPQAAAFTVWNEPNHNAFLLPQWKLRGGTWVPASPHEYRRMLEAVVPRLKAAAPDALVLIGATSSVGSAGGEDRSERMSPLTFTRALACVDEQLRPLDAPECADFRPLPGDGFSHHPYALGLPPGAHDPRPETARIGDLDRMTRLLAQLYQRAAPSRTSRSISPSSATRRTRRIPRGTSRSRIRPAGSPRRSRSPGAIRRCGGPPSSRSATSPNGPAPTCGPAGATTRPACASRTAARNPRTPRTRWR